MIGQAKAQMSGVAIPSNYRVDLNPGTLNTSSVNGASTSAVVFSTVIDGVGPFTYQWIIDNDDITINSPTSENTDFRASEFNSIIVGIAELTVTDTGNGNVETSKTINILFNFGSVLGPI